MEPVIVYVRRKLREAGARRYAAIARAAGVAGSLPRKLATGERENPRIQTIQPLVDYFQSVERGERELPPPDIDPRYLPNAQHREAA